MSVVDSSGTRERRIIGVVSAAHLLSHFYMLALPPLFPLIRDELGIAYTELGLAVTIFAAVTALFQTPMGFVCECIGAKRVLFVGLLLNSAAILLVAFVGSFWSLIALMALAGVGNSVFHPADYSILSDTVEKSRIGRAFAVHSFGGSVGFAAAPVVMVSLAALYDWRFALIAVGLAGIVVSLAVWMLTDVGGDTAGRSVRTAERLGWRGLLTSPQILRLFAFYVGAAAANSGMYYFAAAALTEIYAIELALANTAISGFLFASLAAVLPGGWLADKVSRPDLVLAINFGLSGILCALVAVSGLPLWLAAVLICASGALRGLVLACRDALVHQIAPAGSTGTVFAFVTTGLLIGQAVSPTLYGVAMDAGSPDLVFLLSAAFSLLCLATVSPKARQRS